MKEIRNKRKKLIGLILTLILSASLIVPFLILHADDDASAQPAYEYQYEVSQYEYKADEVYYDEYEVYYDEYEVRQVELYEFLSFACLLELGIDVLIEDDFSDDTVFKFVPNLSIINDFQHFIISFELEIINEDIFNEYINNMGITNFSIESPNPFDALDDIVIADLIELGALQVNLFNEEFGEPEVLVLGYLYVINLNSDSEPKVLYAIEAVAARIFTATAPCRPTVPCEYWFEYRRADGRLFAGWIPHIGQHEWSRMVGGANINGVTATYIGWLIDRGLER